MIRRYIDSAADIEGLVLMSHHPERAWHVGELSQALYITEAAAREQLAKLAAAGFLRAESAFTGPPAYRYAPADPALAPRVAELTAAYATRRVRVIEYIYSRPLDSVRSFARAFKIKRDEHD